MHCAFIECFLVFSERLSVVSYEPQVIQYGYILKVRISCPPLFSCFMIHFNFFLDLPLFYLANLPHDLMQQPTDIIKETEKLSVCQSSLRLSSTLTMVMVSYWTCRTYEMCPVLKAESRIEVLVQTFDPEKIQPLNWDKASAMRT